MGDKKTLLAICAHFISKGVISEYKKMSNIEGYDCILVLNNSQLNLKNDTGSPVVTVTYEGYDMNALLYDKQMHNEFNLPNGYKTEKNSSSFVLVTWYNADYRFYYIKKYLPDYDYYWQIEYDIFCNGSSYAPFLSKYENMDEDLLICKYRPEAHYSDWSWTHGVDWAYEPDVQLYGSFFPISRLSNRAADFLYERRIEQGNIFKSLPESDQYCWPFSELFVPTELMKNGYKCADIDEPNIGFYEFDLNEDRFFEHPDNLLYHPVKGRFKKRLNDCKSEINKLREQISALSKN